MKDSVWISSSGHWIQGNIIVRKRGPKRGMGMLGQSKDSSQVQDAIGHVGGAEKGMKCGNYTFRLHGTKGEG